MSELKELQSLPLGDKIKMTKEILERYIDYHGKDICYMSLSGGIGSTVLYFLLKEVEPTIPAVFINTRNEYPEVVKHVYLLKAQNNKKYAKKMRKYLPYNDPRNIGDTITVMFPEMLQREVFMKKGYLVFSKKVTRQLSDCRSFMKQNPDGYFKEDRFKNKMNTENRYSVSKRYRYLLAAPFPIKEGCCQCLKHSVFERYQRQTGRTCAITGEQASESIARKKSFEKYGALGYDRVTAKCMPLGFWTQQDLLEFIVTYNIPYATCYGDIIRENGKYKTTGETRTGCMFCTAGIQYEKGTNRFQRMRTTHPRHFNYMMKPLEEGGLGMGEVLKWMNIPTDVQEEIPAQELFSIFSCAERLHG